MAKQNETKSLIQRSTAEEYVRRLILLPFQPIISHSDDIFGTRCRLGSHQFCESTRRCLVVFSGVKTGSYIWPLQKENIMKKEDLTVVKHIGTARMKVLNDSGITTIKKLYEIPLEKLARIETIGPYYAKLIKAAVAKSYGEKLMKSAPKAVSVKKRETVTADPVLINRITVLKKRLKQANEKLKPLDKKKYLELYVDFKKRSKTLKTHLGRLNKNPGDLSKKATKNIIKNADALSATLKNVSKKSKKKKYRKISQEIQSFSKMLKKTRS